MIQDVKEERKAFDSIGGKSSFGTDDDASYEEFLESVRASRRK